MEEFKNIKTVLDGMLSNPLFPFALSEEGKDMVKTLKQFFEEASAGIWSKNAEMLWKNNMSYLNDIIQFFEWTGQLMGGFFGEQAKHVAEHLKELKSRLEKQGKNIVNFWVSMPKEEKIE
jgi:hypothetical protein